MFKRKTTAFLAVIMGLMLVFAACVPGCERLGVEKWFVTYTSNMVGASDLSTLVCTAEMGKTTSVTVTPNVGYRFTGWSDGVATLSRTDDSSVAGQTLTAQFELDFLNLPVIYIETENRSWPTGKEEYVPCAVSMLNVEEEVAFSELAAGIRLRGNNSMTYPKKPYRIKFDKKTSPFGWEENKSWVLLALYLDPSCIKDFAAFQFAEAVGTDAFVPNARHVELYVNGSYLGLYLFTDQVDENEGRTSVKSEFDETAAEIPFLVEWDEYAPTEGEEGVDWFKIENEDGVTSYYTVKYPEADERYSDGQFAYVQSYVTKVNELCHATETTQADFEEYVDLKAFLDYYLVQELMAQGEINWKSINMSKAADGKLVMGPLWDYDCAAGGPVLKEGDGMVNYDCWLSSTNWFAYMLQKAWFSSAARARWEEMKPALRSVLEYLADYKATLALAAKRSAGKWDRWTEGVSAFESYYDWVVESLWRRIDAMDELLA